VCGCHDTITKNGSQQDIDLLGDNNRHLFLFKRALDFILIRWSDGLPILRIVEAKASRKDKTYHRIQVALYSMIIRQLLAAPCSFIRIAVVLNPKGGGAARI
jgi:hypothetical protein